MDSFCEELECVFDKLPKHNTKILLGDYNTKVGTEDIFKPTIGRTVYIKLVIIIRVVNFATSKNLTIQSTMFPEIYLGIS
jgi:hypothetical protein